MSGIALETVTISKQAQPAGLNYQRTTNGHSPNIRPTPPLLFSIKTLLVAGRNNLRSPFRQKEPAKTPAANAALLNDPVPVA